MSYIGREAQLQGAYDKVDDISTLFNGTLVTFDIKVNTVNRIVGKTTNLIVSIDGLLQEPDVDYTISGHQITFTSAPSNGTQCGITILGDVFKAPTTGNTDLNSLTDVNTGSLSTNQVLLWDGSNWVNSAQGTTHISGNTDVDTSTSVNGDKLVFDGVEWSGESDILTNINNVDAASPSDNQILTWNDSAGMWQAMDAQSTINSIGDLTDVDTSTAPSTNQILTWNGSSWIPANSQSSVNDINDLDDVDTNAVPPINGQALVWNSSSSLWTPGTVSGGGGADTIDDLNDVDTSTNSPSVGQTLAWDGTNWIPSSSSGGASSIGDLTDVDTSTAPNNGQVLKWNSTSSQWMPQDDLLGSGGGSVGISDIDIYITATGNDTTGDGSSGSPFATIARGVELANTIVTNGNINLLMEVGSTFYIDSEITIDLLSKLIIKPVGTGVFNITTTVNMTTGSVLFGVRGRGTLVLEDCVFNAVNSSIASLNTRSSLLVVNGSGDIETICVNGNEGVDISVILVTCDFKLYRKTSIYDASYIYFINFNINLSNGTDTGSVFNFNSCDISLFDIQISNGASTSFTSVADFTKCNIKEIATVFYDMNSVNNGYCFNFGECSIQFMDMNIWTRVPIVFDNCNVQLCLYFNDMTLAFMSDPLIQCDNTKMTILMDRSEVSGNYDGQYIIEASNMSFINANLNYYEIDTAPYGKTNPKYRIPGETFIFDSNENSCIFVKDSIPYSDPGSGSGSGSGGGEIPE